MLAAGPLIISELLAINATVLPDADGDFSDWIEIYNPSDAAVDLDGWYLTDDDANLTKWQFPDVALGRQEYLIVFASAKDRTDPAGPGPAELHTNFKLDGDGEYLALVHPDGSTIAHQYAPAFPEQRTDVSFGVLQDAAAVRLAPEGLTYRVPQPADRPVETSWMEPGFDDSAWDGYSLAPKVLITEAGPMDPDFVEIQNLSGYTVDTSGWVVAVNNATVTASGRPDINAWHSTLWQLGPSMAADELLYRSDDPDDGDHYWGSNIFWRTDRSGWVMILDDEGYVVDYLVWGYRPDEIASFDVTIDGHHVTAVGIWQGDAAEPIPGGEPTSFQRRGDADHDDLSDFFRTTPTTMGVQNDGLAPRFEGRRAPGIGFETDPPGVQGAVEIDVAAAMHGASASLWTRIPFHVEDPSVLDTMQLQIKYNDGFVAYVNGREVARRNAPDSPGWNSQATAARWAADSLQVEQIDAGSGLDVLRPGANTLAVHGLNVDPWDGNFLLLPELAATGKQYFHDPTPGDRNGPGSIGLVRPAEFSVARGFFEEPFSVEITTDTAAAAIYYTLDGSRPTETAGLPYTAPIPVTTTAMLRAAAFKPGYEPSDVETQTYIFPLDVIRQPANPPGAPSTWGSGVPADYQMDPDVVNHPLYSGQILDALRTHPTISLVMDPVDLWDPTTGIYPNSRQEGPAWERDVSIELIDFPDADDLQVDAGVRIHGSASRNPSRPKHNFRLAFRKEYGLGKLDYPLFGDTEVQLFNDLILRGGNGDSWFHPNSGRRPQAQYTHDQWHKDTQVAMGQPTSQQGDAHVYVNGLYWGFYHVIERPEASFMEEHFGGDKEDYDVLQHKGGTVNGNRVAWNTMMNLVRTTNLSTNAAYQAVLQYIDPVNLADWMLLNFYSANTDWDHNNWYGARKRELGETWKFFSWDAEVTFRNINADITGVSKNDQPTEVHQGLSANAEYRMVFADRVQKHLFNGGALTPAAVEDYWMTRAGEIEVALVAESARWGDHHRPDQPYTVENEFRARQNELRTMWFPRRTGILLNQLRNRGMFPGVGAPSFYIDGAPQHGGPVEVGDLLTMPAAAGTVYYTLDGSDPRLPGGAVSATALAFDGTPIPIGQSVPVKARARLGTTWSALSEAEFFVYRPASVENLVVTELNYNPYDPTPAELAGDANLVNDDFEFIELQNISGGTVDLRGAAFADGIAFDFTGSDVEMLAPGGHVVVAANPAALAARYGATINLAGGYDGRLRNQGEQIRLHDRWGEAIFAFDYDNGGGWPGRATGKGASLELADPAGLPGIEPQRTAFLEDDANWRSSSEYGGSPGSAGSGPIGDVVVNEVLTHTPSPQLDAVELYNTTAKAIDVGGWYLSDSWGWQGDPTNGDYKKFRIPDGKAVPAHGYLVFDENDFNATPGDPLSGSFALDGAHGDDVWLMEADAAGKLTRFVDHLQFDAAAAGQSWGRWPNGQGDPYPMTRPTLNKTQPDGGENSGPRVGPVIVSELQYNASPAVDDDDLEFIEIYNATAAAVDLTDWRIRGGIDYDFPAGATLEARSPLVIVPFELSETDKLTAFRVHYGIDASVELMGGYSGRLSDSGERVRLQRPDAPPPDEPDFIPRLLEDEVRYGVAAPWPSEADGGGPSLNRTETDAWGHSPAGWDALPPTPGATMFVPVGAEVVGRHVFYNDSAFDGNRADANRQDDAAVAPDKAALLPGRTATFANYTSYSAGINGIMVDVGGMSDGAVPGPDDFRFRVGNDNDPGSWPAAAAPSSIAVRPGEGVGGSDRITLIWADNAIRSQWLEVTLLAGAHLGLAEDDVFYFGNAIGESGNSAGDAKVNVSDMLGTRDNQRSFLNPAPIDLNFDFNRDAQVDISDMLIARSHQTHFLNALRLIGVPGSGAAGEGASIGAVLAEQIVSQQAQARQSTGREAWLEALDWLHEFEPVHNADRPPDEDGPAPEAIDQWLAGYGP